MAYTAMHALRAIFDQAGMFQSPDEWLVSKQIGTEELDLILRKVNEALTLLELAERSDRELRFALSNEVSFEVGSALKIALTMLEVDTDWLRIARKRIPYTHCPQCGVKIETDDPELVPYFKRYGCDQHRWQF